MCAEVTTLGRCVPIAGCLWKVAWLWVHREWGRWAPLVDRPEPAMSSAGVEELLEDGGGTVPVTYIVGT